MWKRSSSLQTIFVMQRSTQQRIVDVCLISSMIGAFSLLSIRDNPYAWLGGLIHLLAAAVPGIAISFIISIKAPSRLSLLRCVLLLILSLFVMMGAADSVIALRGWIAAQGN